MKVLLSIKPEFASKIFDGSKRYEYRRVIFNDRDVKNVVVYASAPISKVIGEFKIDQILTKEPPVLWKETKEHAGISKEQFFDYFYGAGKGHAIKIKQTTKYEIPLSLKDTFGGPAPQSFRYV